MIDKDLLYTAESVNEGFPGGARANNLPANAGDARDASSIPGSGRSPGAGKGNLLQDVCLRNSMDRGAWQVPALGVTRVGLSSEHLHSSENFSNWWKKQS